MFSEYASRFLAQSQSRLGIQPDETNRRGYGYLMPRPVASRFSSHSFLHQGNPDPYQPTASQASNFHFSSRKIIQPAPLFHSATDDFREEDDDEVEHEREIADFYALQKSRRHFGSSDLRESSEVDEDDDRNSSLGGNDVLPNNKLGKFAVSDARRTGRTSGYGTRSVAVSPPAMGIGSRDVGQKYNQTKEDLIDIRLEDTMKSDADTHETVDLDDEPPPSVQRFREQPQSAKGRFGLDTYITPTGNHNGILVDGHRPTSPIEPHQTSITPISVESPTQDVFWGNLFLISLACLFATSFLIYLHTSAPSGDKSRWGDTVYMTIHGSFKLLGSYTVVSVLVSLLWLAFLRSYVRQLVYVVIFTVPAILYSFSLYPFVSSFKGAWGGTSLQDKVMRCGSIVPFIMASVWIYNVVRGRHVIGKAAGILELACRILTANAELLSLGLGVLVLIASWTWVWIFMFTRVFLGGHLSGSKSFVVDLSSWWLAIYFVAVYIWSLGVIAGMQRAVTAATVSQWYFHRLAAPAPASRQIVQAAIGHTLSKLFGTICFSRLMTLLIRLPFLLLPRRVNSILSLFAFSLVPTPITALIDPLVITYAAIHSQPLTVSARGLTQMTNISASLATSPLHPQSFAWSQGDVSPLLAYRLSKLILHAARFMMSLALGFGGWVTTARNFGVSGAGGADHSGSMYAYVVGLIAGTIGWSILGAIEGVIADIVDALVICWCSEVGTYNREARYCREAGWLFGAQSRGERPGFNQAEA
ncbi:ctl transporter [Aspergillus taichungensis]|uniref:Protein PNS1 n=1 Tax=Aspergillus taichungensis TaxID=482145 RepID=A0A2J5HL91_9EURO|nr:ctl transporter [Aspergillus taichungensis]